MTQEDPKINRYVCDTCHSAIVTIDRDEGVTPMMLGCRRTKGCKGHMMSSWYRTDQTRTPDYEWYRPESLDGFSEPMQEHIRDGGLVLREIERTSA